MQKIVDFFPLIFPHGKAVVIVLGMKCVLSVCVMYLLIITAEEKENYTIQCVCVCGSYNNSGVATVTKFYEAVLYFADDLSHYSYHHQCYVCK